ncbi:MAG TPA: TonB family protein [Candidatus Sulfotelmatobacter sp.]|nr:TonB family protein [Candidatus Sulfotelmatobacter sp.]
MFELNSSVPKPDRPLLGGPNHQGPHEPKQRRMMIIALGLLLLALGVVLFRDRDFWFPDAEDALDDQPAPTVASANAQPSPSKASRPSVETKHRGSAAKPQEQASVPASPPADPPGAAVTRTVLPPLEVEVVAGDVHRRLHPGTNSVRVDLQAGSPPQAVSVPAATPQVASSQAAPPQVASQATPAQAAPQPAERSSAERSPAAAEARLTNAAERVQMSADTSEVVSRSVKPDYPLLARQMKVQGSVILQAMIGRDGDIQGLHVVSGPPILAGAAQEAVKQWRFKPHYLGSETVETQAKITVNFTISTN